MVLQLLQKMVGVLGETYQKDEVNVAPIKDPLPPNFTVSPLVPDTKLVKGKVYTVGNGKYKVTNVSKKTVAYIGAVKTKSTSISIPATVKVKKNGTTHICKVTSVSAKAFTKCKKLKKVTIGKNVKTIGKEAFKNCKALKKITIKSKVLKSVGKNAIKGINKKAVIKCGKKVKAYKKLFSAKTGFKKKSMKVKK